MLRAGWSFFKSAISDLFFPRTCAFCNSPDVPGDSYLCLDCSDAVRPVAGTVCTICGLAVAGLTSSGTGVCGRCLTTPPPYARARFGVYHDGMLRDALVRFKYQGDLYTGRALSELFVQAFYRHFSGEQFHVLIPVPIHVKRLTNRGFNQSLILAQRLSDATGIPVSRSGLRKITDTPPQVGLKRSERISNLKGSFGVFRPADVRGRRILLVDDVATTGSTIAECARTIRAAKAGRVDVLVLALRTAAGREIVTDSFARNGNDRV